MGMWVSLLQALKFLGGFMWSRNKSRKNTLRKEGLYDFPCSPGPAPGIM